MKNLIAMMNAKKFYGDTRLIHHREAMQEKLSQDMNLLTYQNLVDRIRAKHFLTRA